ncbi:putative glycosyl hydrolase family 71 protein [Phaeomoniella chlamydospora]|uniref:Putative glycosyl hydrolase family 71 protein n=1 Tax=Phaeomoniella chlamydospora TaxID=158046 RepID=A0A0G2GU63_PHACM|nr:putative glycosyl hydrolase family 71 protein [Phaeomoniella chlamydospora]
MHFLPYLCALLSTAATVTALPKALTAATVSSKHYVTAHYLVGNAAEYTMEDWQDDMAKAQQAGIDAFALNIAYGDTNTATSLATAFSAAASMRSRTIRLYLNFDYEAWGAWDATSVVNTINQYQNHSAYFKYNNQPLVSTFEGTSNINDWTSIKAATNCFFMPDWSSIGPSAATTYSNIIDGLASWSAWPDGPTNLTTAIDEEYISTLSGKPYMMPVSPWFYTNLPAYSKNWLWHSSSLWHYRWLESLSLSVSSTFIQILSWNDYGESHYIGPIRSSGIVSGAELYVDSNHSHTAWLDLLPYYIYAYKLNCGFSSSSSSPFLTSGPILDSKERLTYWYKTTPNDSGSWANTTGNNPSYQTVYDPATLSPDQIFFTVLLSSPATVSVTIGNHPSQTVDVDTKGINHFSVPIPSGEAGVVGFEVVRNGKVVLEIKGEEIVRVPENGRVNWNPVVGGGVSM